jgi:NitT/TauT family transport system permease protein
MTDLPLAGDSVASDAAKTARPGPRRTKAPGPHLKLWTWGSIIAGLALWELIGRVFASRSLFLTTPTQALETIWELLLTGELQRHALVSGQAFIAGYVIGCAAGLLIGLAMGVSPRANAALGPWVSGLYATPVIAITPLLILWFGIGVWSKIAVVISLVIFPMIINTDAGVRSTDRALIDAARSFGASQLQIFTKVCLPSAMPFVLAGLKMAVGRGLIAVVVGELFGARAGLGFMIQQAAEVFAMPRLFAGVIVLAAAGILLTALFNRLERVLVPWNRS